VVGGYLDRYLSRTDVSGGTRFVDKLTSLNVGYRGVWSAPLGVQSLSVAVTRGLMLGGSETIDTQTGRNGDPEFTKLQLSYAGKRVLAERWEAALSVDGQYAADWLPASERYSVGGSPFGSAYDPSEISGDHAVAGRIELDRRNGRVGAGWWINPFVAYDIGTVWRIPPASQPERESAASFSLGARAGTSSLSLSLEVAKPLTRSVASQGEHGKDPRVFASGGWKF